MRRDLVPSQHPVHRTAQKQLAPLDASVIHVIQMSLLWESYLLTERASSRGVSKGLEMSDSAPVQVGRRCHRKFEFSCVTRYDPIHV